MLFTVFLSDKNPDKQNPLARVYQLQQLTPPVQPLPAPD
jgi:hypothetical protein